MVNICLITDIHNGPDMGTKKGSAAPAILEQFIEFVAEKKPDSVVDLGDRVNHIDPITDLQSLTQVAQYFEKISVPHAHLIGNHDRDFLTIEDNERVFGRSFKSHSEIIQGVTFLYWNANSRLDRKTGFLLDEEDFLWLEEALQKASYPTVIFSHVPLDNGSMNGNFYFEKTVSPYQSNYPAEQGERLRDIIERSGKVILCVNGHTHWNAYNCIDGIHYVTLPSLTETFLTYPDPHCAWAWLRIENDLLQLDIFGKTPMKYTLPIREETRHWIHRHKDYSPADIAPR